METQEKQIKTAVRQLRKGGVIFYPTDTVPGLGVDATNKKSVERLIKMKGRSPKKGLLVVVSDIQMAKNFVIFSDLAEKIWEEFMPGAVAIILPLKKFVPDSITLASGGTNTLGIRIPNNDICQELVDGLGRPIISTSANKSNLMSCLTANECREQFRNSKDQPDFYIEVEQEKKMNFSSTVISINRNDLEIIREGAVPSERINQFTKKEYA